MTKKLSILNAYINFNIKQLSNSRALRYGLGRRTYITGVISEFIINNIELIPDDQKAVMIRDIKQQEYYGDDCDEKNWMKLLKELEKRIEKEN